MGAILTEVHGSRNLIINTENKTDNHETECFVETSEFISENDKKSLTVFVMRVTEWKQYTGTIGLATGKMTRGKKEVMGYW